VSVRKSSSAGEPSQATGKEFADLPPDIKQLLDALERGAASPSRAALAGEIARGIKEHKTELLRMIESMIPSSTVPLPAQVLQARRNAEAREQLLHEFGAFTSADIGDAAGSKASNRGALAHRWKSDGRVFAVLHRGTTYFPGFQFTAEGQPLPIIAEIVSILGDIRPGWELALWFAASNGWLSGKRPVDVLLTSPAAVLEAARREAEERAF
jgi:hypothetical protein